MARPDPSLQLQNIPGHPTPEDIATARSLFFDHLLVDFRFDQTADRTHALAALLLPFLRRMIDGCTPLHVMEAPAIGSGKSLLCKLVSILLTGEEGDSTTLPANDDDIRKLLTAELVRGRPLILLDNADEKTTLSAPSLAALLTARSWTDRVLGRTLMVTVPNQAMWMFTGNNRKLSRDIARRRSGSGSSRGSSMPGCAPRSSMTPRAVRPVRLGDHGDLRVGVLTFKKLHQLTHLHVRLSCSAPGLAVACTHMDLMRADSKSVVQSLPTTRRDRSGRAGSRASPRSRAARLALHSRVRSLWLTDIACHADIRFSRVDSSANECNV